jgi:hypothetical protein
MILGLKPGDWVEVKSEPEILTTLDEDGAVDGLLFMPEMRRFCGKRLQVQSRADKTCDTVTKTGGRRMRQTVHLTTRCDGSGHGDCHASCLLFWKERWLRRVDGPQVPSRPREASPELERRTTAVASTTDTSGDSAVVRYRCQATDLLKASSPLSEWDLRQYWRDLWSGNVPVRRMVRVMAIAVFNGLQQWRGGRGYPRFPQPTQQVTPSERLELQPGELVQIKSPREIAATLDANYRNRGMLYDSAEQTPHCGGTYRVLKRVERLIDERTGRMMELGNPCLILDGVVCSGDYSPKRYFCPRAIPSYWREVWLRRVDNQAATGSSRP